MDVILKRNRYREDGIFGVLLDDQGEGLFVTLEHAYFDDNFNYSPKLPEGSYICILGDHKLEGMTETFKAFEVTNVPGHTGILFHVGNYNSDSNGCILLGMNVNKATAGWAIESSRIAFEKFMKLQDGVTQFTLIVG
jgi:Family of unknown function (DUF5675)